MGLIEDELNEIKKCCEAQVAGTKVVSLVPAMVRVELEKSPYKKIIVSHVSIGLSQCSHSHGTEE